MKKILVTSLACAAIYFATQAQVAPPVQPYYNNGGVPQPVDTGHPLPVTVPSPCATFSAADQGCTVHTLNNLPAPTVIGTSGPITSATTAPIVTGSTSLWTFIAHIGALSTAANSADTVSMIAGATGSANCDTPEVALTLNVGPMSAVMAGAGNQVTLWGGGGGVLSNSMGIIPAAQDLIIPPNTPAINICGITAGTTIAIRYQFAYTTRSWGLGYFLMNRLFDGVVADAKIHR